MYVSKKYTLPRRGVVERVPPTLCIVLHLHRPLCWGERAPRTLTLSRFRVYIVLGALSFIERGRVALRGTALHGSTALHSGGTRNYAVGMRRSRPPTDAACVAGRGAFT